MARFRLVLPRQGLDRFAEPWAEMFGMMWTFMARTALASGGKCGLIQAAGKVRPPPAWVAEYCISAGVSGRSVNQSRTLAALTYIGQLAPIFENMTLTLGPESVKAFMLWIFNTVDTELARRVLASENKGGPSDKEGGVLKEELGVRI